jgi:hypothetical protein
MNSSANLGSANFPSLGGGSRATASSNKYAAAQAFSKKNLSSDNFPSLGGGSSGNNGSKVTASTNKYAAAQAFSKKNLSSDNFPSLGGGSSSSASDYPALSYAKKKKSTVFEAKKPPALDNVLHFPTPTASASASASTTSNGKAQVEKMKSALGQPKYKELKKLTKSFATSELDPESYVSSALSLFDKGIEDSNFWAFVPNLISSCPNESSSKRAMRYLDSVRYPLMQTQSNTSTSRAAVAKSGGGGGWSDHVNSIQTSFQKAQQAKKKKAWVGTKTPSKIGNTVIAAAAAQPKKGTATKFMAKEKAEAKKMNKIQSEAQQGGGAGKKSKAKAKKNELRELAFGKV